MKRPLVFFPASGRRDYATGGMNYVSSVGYDWSASPNSTAFGCYLYFNSTDVNPSNNFNRANGFPVRCLQAFTPAGFV